MKRTGYFSLITSRHMPFQKYSFPCKSEFTISVMFQYIQIKYWVNIMEANWFIISMYFISLHHLMLNRKIMDPRSYGGNKSGACFIEVKYVSTFSVAQTQELKPLNWKPDILFIYYIISLCTMHSNYLNPLTTVSAIWRALCVPTLKKNS